MMRIDKRIGFVAVLCCFLVTGCSNGKEEYKTAVRQTEMGQYEEAITSFQKAIAQNGERAEYYIGYGMALDYLGKYKDAIVQFEKAYQDVNNSISKENNKQVYYGEAIAYSGLHQYDKAIGCCENALKLKNPEAINVELLMVEAGAQIHQNSTSEALKLYERALKIEKENWAVYLARAELEMTLGKTDAAAADYRTVVDSGSGQKYDGYFGLYQMYLELGNEDSATEVLNQVIALKDDKDVNLTQLGRAYTCQGDYSRAEKYLQKALKAGDAQANYYLGDNAIAQADYETASVYYQTYLEDATSSTSAKVYNQLAGCAIALRDYKTAQNYLEQGLEMNDLQQDQTLRRNEIILLEKQKKYKKAKKQAKLYLQDYPEDQDMQKELNFIKTRIKKKAKTDAKLASQSAITV